jgi:ABC-type branched-subunit amino acid transport system substrate-binding protein
MRVLSRPHGSVHELIARMGLFHIRRGISCLALTLAVLTGGCQSSAGPEALESAKADAGASSSAPVVALQSFGSGPARIDIFLDSSIANSANDYRDGAALAVKELGAGQLTLVAHDLRAQGVAIAHQIKLSADGGTRMLIGPPSLAKALADTSSKQPAMLLAANASASAVAIQSDEIGGAIEIASYAAGAGRAKIMVVSTRPLDTAEVQRLRAGLKKAGVQLLDIVTDPTSADGAAKLARLGEAQAVLLIGADAPKIAAPALRQRGGLDASVPFLGTYVWPASTYGEPVLEGSLLALIDQNALKRISGRFQSAYARPLSLEAAYGFDAVAVAAGIVRTKGPDALKPVALRSSSGFTGATGTFRFNADGHVERRLAIYRLSGGKLVLQDGAPSGF